MKKGKKLRAGKRPRKVSTLSASLKFTRPGAPAESWKW
jgi:hypothetical protein